MSPLAGISPALIARARADQVATVYASWNHSTASMLFGAALLIIAMWGQVSAVAIAGWLSLVALNQAWRFRLVRKWRRARPGPSATMRWGRYWAIGSAAAGALWGVAAVVVYPASLPHQALLIVCLFGVVLGGVNLTAVWRPSFDGFVLAVLVPVIVRVALEADAVHINTALVMTVVLVFVLVFGHRVNDVLTQALATRYENIDLIAELKGQTRAAVEARAAAESANRAKSQLLAAASHDLRQPLHAVGLYVAALGGHIDAEGRSLIARVQSALDALEAQFGQLIDLSRLEAGALVVERARVPLGALFAAIASELRPQAEAKGLRLVAIQTRLAVDSDPALLARIVRNLVANAVRYTRSGGVVIGARRRADRVSIQIVDTGIGIAPEHQARIFEEFFQVRRPGASSSAGRGMGLGLALVRRFADLLGHKVTVVSTPGRGSRFGVEAPRVVEVRSPLPHELRGKVRWSASATDAMLSGATVAIIDDDPASVDAMCTLLSSWGACVAGGHDASSALASLGELERYPDLIVADLRLDREASGLDAVATLRHELGVRIPALVVSGDTGASAAHSARAAGLALLPKPVQPGALAAAATALIASSRA